MLFIEYGYLVNLPIYEERPGGRNWAATIKADPKAPAGLQRQFWPRGRGGFYYQIPDWVKPPSPVEFGADWLNPSSMMSTAQDPISMAAAGQALYEAPARQRNRWYGVVTGLTSTQLTLQQAKNGLEAVRLSRRVLDTVYTQPKRRRWISLDHEEK